MLNIDVTEEGLLNPRTGQRISLNGIPEAWLRDLAKIPDHDIAKVALLLRTRAVRMQQVIDAIYAALNTEADVHALIVEIKALSMEMKMLKKGESL